MEHCFCQFFHHHFDNMLQYSNLEARNNQLVNYEYVPGRILRYLGLDIAWFISSPERFRTKPSWFNFVGKNIYYQEGGLKDWKAMVCSIYEGIKKQLSPSFRASKANMNE